MELAKSMETFKRGDVDRRLPHGRSKNEELLGDLVKRKPLNKIGNGKTTCYSRRTD